MKKSVLVCWIGNTDLRAADGKLNPGEWGPVAAALRSRSFTEVHLLSDFDSNRTLTFVKWLAASTGISVRVHEKKLTSPVHFGEIYEAAVETLSAIKREHRGEILLTFHLSPGSPAMAAVWIILAKTAYPAELIESSVVKGVNRVSVPFEIAADYLPNLPRRDDEDIVQVFERGTLGEAEFEKIIHRSRGMKELVRRAKHLAKFDVPVLILGESGTGKELVSRALHAASARHDKPFVAVNCGAIPKDLVETEFFGHCKGAFSGASSMRKGHLEVASGGTLFLDEIGELPLSAQVKLLRALQEKRIRRVGETAELSIDLRVIAATNRNLSNEICEGLFREDLYHRLAVGLLRIPPLRERIEEITPIVEKHLESLNREFSSRADWTMKRIAPGALNFLKGLSWQGNVRELLNTVTRAALWTTGEVIRESELRAATGEDDAGSGMRSGPSRTRELEEPLMDEVDLPDLLAKVARRHLTQAMEIEHGNKSAAARRLGLPNYQTLSNWLVKYKVEV